MFNPFIIVAIVVQSFIARANKMAGAITGFVITTGILLWGLSVYSGGDQITFFGNPMDEGVFIFLCLVWYGFDVYGLIKARKLSALDSENRDALADPAARAIWSSTWRAWRANSNVPPAAIAEANRLSEDAFVDGYIKKTGRLIQSITSRSGFQSDDFIIYITINPAHDISVLTNRTLYLFANRDISSGPAQIIPLADIQSYAFDTSGKGRIHIQLRSGQVIDEERNAGPKVEFLNKFLPVRQLA
jgi:hypothetical protein